MTARKRSEHDVEEVRALLIDVLRETCAQLSAGADPYAIAEGLSMDLKPIEKALGGILKGTEDGD